MATIRWGGHLDINGVMADGQTASFNRPSELKNWGYPEPPRQPIASWAAELATFQAACTNGAYEGAVASAITNWVLVSNADVPGGALAGLQRYLTATYPRQDNAPNTGLPPCFNTAAGQTWRA